MKIDESWYIKPEKIVTSTSAGGVIVRVENDQPLIALVEEQPFGIYILPRDASSPVRSWKRLPGVKSRKKPG